MDADSAGRAFRYRAFVSYSHADMRVGRRVQRALESFRVPSGIEAAGLTKTRTMGRIFRDEDDLGAADTLTGAIRQAIGESENLIVVCSPRSAASKWVNQEIELFRSLHGSERIYALIIDGSPNAPDPAQRCFPSALANKGGKEPLAPNLRQDGLARVAARLAAGMLKLPFDDLWRRAQRAARQQTRRRIAVQAGVFAAVAALLAGLYVADTNQIVNAAEVARDYAAGLAAGPASASWRPSAAEQGLIGQASKTARAHLTLDFDDVLKQRPTDAGWTLAQELIALHGENAAADTSALALMRGAVLPGTSCWAEYVADASCHAAATAWALNSLATLGLAAAPRSLSALLDAQDRDGWWPLYLTLHGDRSYASNYATAWALLALDAQSRFASPQLQQRIALARTRAINWLISSEDPRQHAWKDYPDNQAGTISYGVSGLVVVALNRSPTDPRVAAIDRAWLSHLAIFPGKVDEIERSNVPLGDSWKWDRTSYIVTPWVALSADEALGDGTLLGRAKGRTYLDRFVRGLAAFDPKADPNYLSTELVLCLRGLA